MHIAIGTRLRTPGLRTRILGIALIPSLSLMLVGLGSAVVTGYRGFQETSASGQYAALSGDQTGTGDAATTGNLLQALRTERQLTGEVLGDPATSTTALQSQWTATDAAAAAMARTGSGAAPPLTSLLTLRPEVLARSISLTDAISAYSALIVDVDSRASTNLAQAVPDPLVVQQDEINKQLSDLTEALEVSQALSFAAFSSTGMSNDEFREYTHQTGDFEALLRSLQPSLPADEAATLNQLTTGTDGEIVGVVQRAIVDGSVLQPVTAVAGPGSVLPVPPSGSGLPIQDSRLTAPLPVTRADWLASASRLAAGLVALQRQHLAYSAGIARQIGTQQIRTALLGSLALVVFALVVLAVTLAVSRTLIGRLQRLRQETITLSHERLPVLVARLRDGKQVDVDAELAPLDFGSDEIGQVADAFSEAQRTAVAAAAQEAETRAGLRAVFLDIAHRSQAITYRQLKVIDQAERTEEDPDQLELLFQLDHLSTRARRNAENLIILGGGQAGRQWRNPVALLQLIRSSISESEHYTRVNVVGVPKVTVIGAAVADLIHLLAELVDNATSFSPPLSRVEVRGNLVGRGVVIEIEDQGLGIEAPDLERFNQTLHDPPDFQVMALAEEPRLGLFVVARLAARHGIRVTLTASAAYGGTKVVVLLPATLLLAENGVPSRPEIGAAPEAPGPARALWGPSSPQPVPAPSRPRSMTATADTRSMTATADTRQMPAVTQASPVPVVADAPPTPTAFESRPRPAEADAPPPPARQTPPPPAAYQTPPPAAHQTPPTPTQPPARQTPPTPTQPAAHQTPPTPTQPLPARVPGTNGSPVQAPPRAAPAARAAHRLPEPPDLRPAPDGVEPQRAEPQRADRLITILAEPVEPSDPVGSTQPAEPSVPATSANGDRPELPRRTRQAHLSPKLKPEVVAPVAAPATAAALVDPETARSRMSALQRGTMRGRATDREPPR